MSLLSGFGQPSTYKPLSECENFNSFINLEGIEQIKNYADTIMPGGIILFHNFDLVEPEFLENHLSWFGLDTNTFFVLDGSYTNPFDENILYERYQQYYKNVKVEGGGYAIKVRSGPDDPCAALISLSPYIAYNIDIETEPSIPLKPAMQIMLDTLFSQEQMEMTVETPELVISQNDLNDCNYHLCWKMNHYADSQSIANNLKISWLDAHSGVILKNVDPLINLTAPTQIYGVQNLVDKTIGGRTTLETPSSDIESYFFQFGCSQGFERVFPFRRALMPATVETEWTISPIRPLACFQAHYIMTTIKPLFESIGIHFNIIQTGYCGGSFPNAGSAFDGNPEWAVIYYGNAGNEIIATIDIFAHELSHTYLHNFLGTDNKGNASLHEGLANIIATFIELIGPQGSIDWTIGDDNPNFPPEYYSNLADPTYKCFTDVKNLPRHPRGEPLGYWFFLITHGSQADNIPALGIEKALSIILDAIKMLGPSSDYPDLKNIIISNVLNEYGKCSDEHLAVVRAFNKICVTPAHDCAYTIAGCSTICEESDYMFLYISGGLPNTHYRWTWYTNKCTEWVAQGSQTGNSVEGGESLTIIDFPKYEYYPQYFTIDAYAPIVGPNYIQKKKIKLIDCLGDDPTCDEYYNNSIVQTKSSDYTKPDVKTLATSMVVIDYIGRIIYQGKKMDQNSFGNPYTNMFLFFQYYDDHHNFLYASKVFIPKLNN